MPAAANLDWLYHTLGYAFAAAGLAVTIWALFPDPHRKKRRCPKCWYDMTGTPGLRCSECGHIATTERKLHKVRRRWRAAAPAIILVVLAHAAWGVPRYQARGWVGFIPSTALILYAPAKDDPNATPGAGSSSFGSSPIATTAIPLRQQLFEELWVRLRAGDLAGWQSHTYLTRVLKANSIDPAFIARLPARWPLGLPVPTRATPEWVEGLIIGVGAPGDAGPISLLPAPPGPCQHMDIEVRLLTNTGLVLYRSTHRVPINIITPSESFMQPIDSPELTAHVQADIAPHLAMRDGAPVLILHDLPDPSTREHFPFLLAYTVEVHARGRTIATHAEDAPWKSTERINWAESRIQWPPGTDEALLRDATITIRGDRTQALNVFMQSAFDNPYIEYWTGEFTAPLSFRPHPRPEFHPIPDSKSH